MRTKLPTAELVRKKSPVITHSSHRKSANQLGSNRRVHYGDQFVPSLNPPATFILRADARHLPLSSNSVDLVVTSPPYWRKRDYGLANEIGQEPTVAEYIKALVDAIKEWKRVLRPTGSVFLNIGDTYYNRGLAGVPARIETAARDNGWVVRNRIIWAKGRGMPDPAQNRLTNRHEYILHLVAGHDYYYDLYGYAERFGSGANPGDVWHFNPTRNMADHLAPFPDEMVERAVVLACPSKVCVRCGRPRRRLVRRTFELNPRRPQARRAMEIAQVARLSPEHIAAIQATGISDAGKALRVQNGTGRNSAKVRVLAAEAKKVLGGYFREFVFAQRRPVGWTRCSCKAATIPGVVLDPFSGTGTTVRVAAALGRTAIGSDISPSG